MGCDIHWLVEVKEDGVWKAARTHALEWFLADEVLGEPRPHYDVSFKYDYNDRDYALFGRLAGVRGEGPPVKEPAGFPSDMSSLHMLLVGEWGGDVHTPTWFTPDELRAAGMNAQADALDELAFVGPVRVIVFFDN